MSGCGAEGDDPTPGTKYSISDYSQMKDKLAMEVVSAETNKEIIGKINEIFKAFDCSETALEKIVLRTIVI